MENLEIKKILISANHPAITGFRFPSTHKKLNPKPVKYGGKIFNIIISDFRSDVGDIPDIISFNKEFLNRPFLSPKQIEAYQAVWGTKGGEWNTKFHEIVLLIGMKGGKNFWSEGDLAYTCFFISALRDPHDYFTKITKRLVPYTHDKKFDIVNVSSVDENQARRAFFESGKQALKNTTDPKSGENWFEKFIGLDLREQFGDFKGKEVTFPTTKDGKGGIRLMSFNSTAKAPEGMHMIKFYADELSRADTKARYKEASGLYDLGINNTRASFPNNVGKVLGWAYPNDTDFDLTNERYELSLTTDEIFGMKLTTYDFNPSLTKEMLSPAYKADEKKAKRIYECIKSISKDNFFQPHAGRLRDMKTAEVANKIKYKRITITRTAGNQKDTKEYTFTGLEILELHGDNLARCFTADPSKIRDRFTILGGYAEVRDPLKMDVFINDQAEVITTNIKPIVDVMIVIEPLEGCPIDYVGVGNIYSALIKAFPNIQSFNSDHFQNEKLRQELISQGIQAETYFFSNAMQLKLYTMLRMNVWNNNIIVCDETDMFLTVAGKDYGLTDFLIQEAERVTQEGGKIDHPKNGSKDILDSLAILNYDIMNLEAQGVTEDVETMNDDKLSKLCSKYINERYELEQKEDLSLTDIEKLLQQRLNLTSANLERLKEYVEERYYK
jgi:hypothetical protein